MCGSPIYPQRTTREARKNVAILFMDLVGSTALAEMLDPESWRQIIDRYFDAVSSAIAAYDGAVEKFIGDAVMAVFGATVSHEDDALRAVRAAMEAVAKVGELNIGLVASHKVKLEVRSGICSGEVIAITEPNGDFRVIGDPVNTSARLQTAAAPGQILIDTASASMVRAVIGLDPVRPLELKGKAQPVPAWLVTGSELPADVTVDPPATPLIGREAELGQLRSAYRQVTKDSQVGMVTVVGTPGIGKSRLVRSFVEGFADGEVTVLTGRCSAYGRGITYKPLADMLRGWPGGWGQQAERMQAGGGEARRAVGCLSGVAGGNKTAAELAGINEISWAVRYLLARLGRAKPVIMVWEDLQWAESTLLDMLDGVVRWLTDVPVLLICVSRHDLREARPDWGVGRPSAMTLEVNPLSYEHSAELVAEIAMHEEVYAHQQDLVYEQVARECEGNPLFAELMLDVVAETASNVKLPPPISAVLTARLDQLPDDERRLLEIASVIGSDFSWPALRAMLAAHDVGDSQAQEIVARLVGRRLISRVSSGEFRFDQVLMRDTAYQLVPKSRRERLHLLLAGRLAQLAVGDGTGADSSPDDLVALAYHVETANKLRRELRPGDTRLPELAANAAEILISEGMKALHRTDFPGAAALLERARELMPAADERQISLMLYISDCWYRLSEREPAMEALDLAAVAGNRQGELVCAIARSTVELRFELAGVEDVSARADQYAAELRAYPDDDRAWCRLHQLFGYLYVEAERFAKAEAEFRLALRRATAMRDSYEEDKMLGAICELAQWSPTTVTDGLRLCAEMSERFATNGAVLVPVLLTKARLAGLDGDLNGARAAVAAVRAHLSDLHLDMADAIVLGVAALVDSLAGEHRKAEMSYRSCQGLLLEMGRPCDAAAYEAFAARELFEQGKVHETGVALGRLNAKAHVMDTGTKVMVDALGARVSAVSGRAAQVVDFAASTARLSEQMDDLCLQGNCYVDLAIVAAQAGQQGAAADAAAVALDRYLAKGASQLAVRAERLLATLGDRQPPERSRH